MATLSINDVRALIGGEGWDIQKDTRFTCRRFIMMSPDGERIPIRYTPTVGEMIAEIKKKSVAKFTAEYAVKDDDGAGARLLPKKGAKAVKRAAAMAIEPSGLKSRRAANMSAHFMSAETAAVEGAGEIAPNTAVEPLNFGIQLPKKHKQYYFPVFNRNVVTRLAMGRNIFLSGPGGCGKTEYVYALGDMFGVRVVRVNFHVGTTEQHLIGRMTAQAGETRFVYGLLTLAMIHGWWIVFDEIDYAMPEHMSVLQPVLEGNPLIVTQNRGETIVPHENFRMFATANTKGRGDETQGYTGTNFLNMAFLDRWSIFEMDYSKDEPNICAAYVQDDKFVAQLVRYFNLLRKASYGGELNNAIFSTRRMIQVCEALAAGESLKEALTYELWSRYDKHEIDVMKEYAADVWDRETYFSGNWRLGDAHKDDQKANS